MAQDRRNLFPILCKSLAGSVLHDNSGTFILPSDGSIIPQDLRVFSCILSAGRGCAGRRQVTPGGVTWPGARREGPHFYPYTHTSHWPEPTLKTTLVTNRSNCLSRGKGKCLPVSSTLLTTTLTSTLLKNPSPPFDKYTHSLFNKYFLCTSQVNIDCRPGPCPHFTYSITKEYGTHEEKIILNRYIYK